VVAPFKAPAPGIRPDAARRPTRLAVVVEDVLAAVAGAVDGRRILRPLSSGSADTGAGLENLRKVPGGTERQFSTAVGRPETRN
jgi:hypothetical protein